MRLQHAGGLNDDRGTWHVRGKWPTKAGGRAFDFGDGVHARHHFAKHGVAGLLWRGVEEAVVRHIDKEL